jgi:TATA-box binding protein (TBP) (component of TFIID and TFIIIB)
MPGVRAIRGLAPALDATVDVVGADFRTAFNRIHGAMARCVYIRPLPVVITTMTMTGKMVLVDEDGAACDNKRPLPMDKLNQVKLVLEIADAMDATYEFELAPPPSSKRKRGASDGRSFRCQLSLVRNGKSVKVYHTGSVHVTGCASCPEFLAMMESLCAFFAETAGLRVQLASFDIQLINVLFTITCPHTGRPMTVAPSALHRRLDVLADVDFENNPSVKIAHKIDGVKVATVCVFQTGNVSVLGAKRATHVAAAIEEVCGILDRAAPTVCTADANTRVRTTTSKQGMCLVDGYPHATIACCM